MVQMSMDRIESTTGANPDERWIRSENFFRRHFDDPAAGDNFKNYYYGMFNFAKAMRTATPSPVIDIGTQVGFADGGVGCGPNVGCVAGGPQPLDWYNDPVSGLARAIVDYQILPGNPNTEGACGGVQPGPCPNIGGFTDRPGNSHGSSQDDHNVPWATQILTRSLFQAGPIAVAEASPNPTAENVPVTFDPKSTNRLSVTAVGDALRVALNGREVITTTDDTYKTGTVGLRVVDTHASFRDLEITPPAASAP